MRNAKKIIHVLTVGTLMGLFAGFAVLLSNWAYRILLIALIFITTDLIWTLFSPRIRNIFGCGRNRFTVSMSTCLSFLLFGGMAMNDQLPRWTHPISLSADAGILCFVLFFTWGLIKQWRKEILLTGVAGLTLFVYALVSFSPTGPQHREPDSTALLKSIPYLSWGPSEKNLEGRGVTQYKKGLAYEGLNIYNNLGYPGAFLVDMTGKVVHTWSDGIGSWEHVEMYDNGDLLRIAEDHSLARLDWNSHVAWSKKMRFHHDIAISENRNIYALTRRDEIVLNHGFPTLILNDYIVILSPNGKTLKEISLYKILKEKIPPSRLNEIYQWMLRHPKFFMELHIRQMRSKRPHPFYASVFDIFHTNSIEIIDRNIEGFCKKGNILISMRELDLIGILDIEREELIWSWGQGHLEKPHHPTLLKNGNILIFDNGNRREYTRIVELNPLTEDIVWEYHSEPPNRFYTHANGGSQRLPNGNTLITESESGHVFEITADGQIVWEFYNPAIDQENEERKVIYRMTRITDPEKYPVLVSKKFMPVELSQITPPPRKFFRTDETLTKHPNLAVILRPFNIAFRFLVHTITPW